MKKTLLIAAAVAMSFVACSKEEIQTVGKGMTLSANVADDNTKATITDEGGKIWSFHWEANDAVAVTAPGGAEYNFVKPETGDFKCEAAVPAAGDWTAVYPKSYTTEGISFVHQDGTLKSAMEKYLLTGSCPSDGSSKLSCTMEPKFAIFKITNTGTYANDCQIYVCTGTSSAGSRVFITSINTDGSFNKSTSDADYIGTIKKDEVKYFIVPAEYIRFRRYTPSSTSSKMGTAKTVEAGKVYNLNINF